MIARFTASAGTGALVTFGLLFLMQLMITTGRVPLTSDSLHVLVPDIRVAPPPPDPAPPKRAQRLDPNPPPPRVLYNGAGGDGPEIGVPQPVPPNVPTPDSNGFAVLDGDALPIVKVTPNYPVSALKAGLEGYVIVEFTITRTGSVEDVSVVESSDRVFERAAIDAASRFRYRPRIIDGEFVEVHGKQHLISFRLDNE